MILTQLEASKKYCCNGTFQYCCGEKCMAWRWHTKSEPTTYVSNASFPSTPIPGKELPKEQWTGYCGLAGGLK